MRRARLQRVLLFGLLLGMWWPGVVHAAGDETSGQHAASVFLWIALLLIAARLGGLVERLRQPPVLGELAVGIVLGNLSLCCSTTQAYGKNLCGRALHVMKLKRIAQRFLGEHCDAKL